MATSQGTSQMAEKVKMVRVRVTEEIILPVTTKIGKQTEVVQPWNHTVKYGLGKESRYYKPGETFEMDEESAEATMALGVIQFASDKASPYRPEQKEGMVSFNGVDKAAAVLGKLPARPGQEEDEDDTFE